MKPQVRQLSKTIFEFFWQGKISDLLLQNQLFLQEKANLDFKSELLETRMGFTTLALVFKAPFPKSNLTSWLSSFDDNPDLPELSTRIWEVPVCYDLEYGRDLEYLSQQKNKSISEIIELHKSPLYRLHFYGFLPGFMYLNGLPTILHTSRKSVPDRSVPKGSVAIGGSQTGIYPSESPGGWHIIGRSPLQFFDPSEENPVFAKAGDQIQFVAISKEEFGQQLRLPKTPNLQ